MGLSFTGGATVHAHLEYKNSDTWSRPHNWHCRLWTYLSRTICRPGWNPFRREIRARGHKWQHTPVRVIRRLQPSSSQWHIWFSVVSSTAHLCNHAASKSVFFFFELSIYVIDSAKGGHANSTIIYGSVAVQVSSVSLNIHPNGINSKCVDILGANYENNTAVDLYVTLLICSIWSHGMVCLASTAPGFSAKNGGGTVVHWLQLTLWIILNGVLMQVLVLNVSIYFLGLCSFTLILWQGPMVSRWKYINASLAYRNKPGHLTSNLVLSNWLLRISAWILRMGTRPTGTSCRFGPVIVLEITKSGLRLQPSNGSLSLFVTAFFHYCILRLDSWCRRTFKVPHYGWVTNPTAWYQYGIVLYYCNW